MNQQEELIPHLFRTEFTKITSVLCKLFGIEHIETAEDIASETFLSAVENWTYKGIPENPTAWLYVVAKNKAKNYLQRNGVFENKVAPALKNISAFTDMDEIDLSAQNISDSQLQMMFALSHPSISKEAQVGLSLRILCGFGIEEIADAFLSNKETINKRLFRAKETLRKENIKIELPPASEIDERLSSVLTTIYLLFNEGYYSASQDEVLRKDLCYEAMRLCTMLTENALTNKPEVNALLALMCFHASRFDARFNKNGEMILYEEQDETLWDRELIIKGAYYLKSSARGNQLSAYHLEACIAYWNTQKEDTAEKWENVLQLYNRLLQIQYSPVAALNRTYALYKANGRQQAIVEAEKINLSDKPFYWTLLGELYTGIDNKKARQHFQKALSLAKTQPDKKIIQKKIDNLFE
jgi:RNA polymerase sigma-70 factor (ECF subfamily)